MFPISFQWAPLQILRSSNRASFRVPSLPGYYLPGSKARKSTYRQSWLFKGDAIFFVFILLAQSNNKKTVKTHVDKSKNATPEMILASWSMGFTEFLWPRQLSDSISQNRNRNCLGQNILVKPDKTRWIDIFLESHFQRLHTSQTYVCLNVSSHEPLLLNSLVQIKLWKSLKLIFLENSFNKDKSVGL